MNRKLLVLAGISFAFAAMANAQVLNGGFESGLSPWGLSGSVSIGTGVDEGNLSHSGNSWAYFYGETGTLSQTVSVNTGDSYALTFFMQNYLDGGASTNELDVYWNGSELTPSITNVVATPINTYTEYTYNVTAGASLGTLSFTGANTSGQTLLDDVSMQDTSATPEPGTLSTGLGALMLMTFMARNRFRKSA